MLVFRSYKIRITVGLLCILTDGFIPYLQVNDGINIIFKYVTTDSLDFHHMSS